MRLRSIIVPAAVVLLCAFSGATPPSDSSTCLFSPYGTVHIDVDGEQTFVGSDSSCNGLQVYITLDDGTAGFNNGCSVYSTTAGGNPPRFKVWGCSAGYVYINIWDGSTFVQSITVQVIA